MFIISEENEEDMYYLGLGFAIKMLDHVKVINLLRIAFANKLKCYIV